MPLVPIEKVAQSLAPIRVGVIGAGVMGSHHCRVYNTLNDVELVAIVDCDEDRAREAAIRFGCNAYTSIEDLIGKVDAVSIASPSSLHAEMGLFFIENGIHCLIEKPLATTEADCLRLIEASKRNNVILLVGHIEQFNPAVQELRRILSQGVTIHGIDVARMNGNITRILDVDVVLDLMIHDLDIVLSFMNEPCKHVSAEAVFNETGKNADYVSALLSFSNGVIANFKASKITQKKVRQLSLTTSLGFITLDYAAQELFIHKQLSNNNTQIINDNPSYKIEQVTEKVAVTPREPLWLELDNFIQSVRSGLPTGVDAHQALASLKLVWEIQKKISIHPVEYAF